MGSDMLYRSLLYDTYGGLLTEKQRLCFDLHYNQDYSLGEIGELEGISRQAVRDNIQRAERQMQDYEQQVGMLALQDAVSRAAAQLRDLMEHAEGMTAQQIIDAAGKAAAMLEG